MSEPQSPMSPEAAACLECLKAITEAVTVTEAVRSTMNAVGGVTEQFAAEQRDMLKHLAADLGATVAGFIGDEIVWECFPKQVQRQATIAVDLVKALESTDD